MYDLGYYEYDLNKQKQVEGFIKEAEEFMLNAGVLPTLLSSKRAYAVKSLWADARDKGEVVNLISSNAMITHLISQMKR